MLATSPQAKPTSWPYGIAPDSMMRTTGLEPSWPTCAPLFAGPPMKVTLTTPLPSRRCQVGWAICWKTWSRLLGPKNSSNRLSAVDHPRLVDVCAIASLCYMLGRIDDALAYSDAGRVAMARGVGGVPIGLTELWLGAVYSAIGEPERYVDFYRDHLTRCRDTYGLTRACVAVALANAGHADEARSVATGMIEAAEATHNPYVVSFALLCYGMAWSEEDPHRALDALHRGVTIAQESGSRSNRDIHCDDVGDDAVPD